MRRLAIRRGRALLLALPAAAPADEKLWSILQSGGQFGVAGLLVAHSR